MLSHIHPVIRIMAAASLFVCIGSTVALVLLCISAWRHERKQREAFKRLAQAWQAASGERPVRISLADILIPLLLAAIVWAIIR